MHAVQYASPRSLSDALTILQEAGPTARLLAGGTDIIPQAATGLRDVSLFVDSKRIPELMELVFDPDRGLTIGAAVSCCRLYENPETRQRYPGLIDSVSLIGSTAIQGRASVGGNLCTSGPAADTIPMLIAYSATARIAGPHGERTVPVENFCTAPGRNVLAPDELLVSLHLPVPAAHSGAHYLRFIPRNEMDIAVVGVGVSLTLTTANGTIAAARIALGAVAPIPLFVPEAGAALVGQMPSAEAFAQAAAIAQTAARPISDMRGTAEHRRHLTEVLTRRALIAALGRTGNNA